MDRIPFIHFTDIFRPHEDPDDHYDLACAYSLHLSGRIDLKGIVVDYPPPHHDATPDAPGIEMLNHITGLEIPFAVGQEEPMASGQPVDTNAAVKFLVGILEDSDAPVVINLVGSCRDIAIAIRDNRDLFRNKCRAIYLNAGTGYTPTGNSDEIEYNVRLDAASYVSLLDTPCPLYWCPCFHRLGVNMLVHERGTWYRFLQGDILPYIDPSLQAYFAYMFARDSDPDWRKWLDLERSTPVIEEQCQKLRPMWSTAGMLHAAGLDVPGAFSFDRVAVKCTDDGRTTWVADQSSSTRLLRIDDQKVYREKMPAALKRLMLDIKTASIKSAR